MMKNIYDALFTIARIIFMIILVNFYYRRKGRNISSPFKDVSMSLEIYRFPKVFVIPLLAGDGPSIAWISWKTVSKVRESLWISFP